MEERERPEPGHTLIRVHACGACPSALTMLQGAFVLARFSLVPGHEVEEVGEGVEWPKRGDRVGVPWLYYSCGQCKRCTRGATRCSAKWPPR